MKYFVPEVIQTSAMDCGPASLKSLFEGFGVPVNYSRLREACQTDIDGTSIDSLEIIAGNLGLDVEQIMLPADFLLLPDAHCLPAIIVVSLPQNIPHFIVVWKIHKNFIQIMDPAVGRRWVNRQQFLDSLYLHDMRLPAADWREWACSDLFCNCVRFRLTRAGVSQEQARAYILKA